MLAKLLICNFLKRSSFQKVKDEKRPWVLRAKEASVQVGNNNDFEDNRSLPQTLIYISCGWERFKEVYHRQITDYSRIDHKIL